MFDGHRRTYSILLLAIDIGAGLPALWISYSLRSHPELAPLAALRDLFSRELLPLQSYLLFLLAFAPFQALLLWVSQSYDELFQWSMARQFRRVFRFLVVAGLSSGAFLFFFQPIVSRPIWLLWLLVTGFFMLANRLALHWVYRSRTLNEHNRIKILIVGTNTRSRQIGETLSGLRKWGYEVVGYLEPNGHQNPARDITVLGALGDLPELLQGDLVADEIIFVDVQKSDPGVFETMIQLCEELGIRTRVAADYFPTSMAKVSLEYLNKLPLITFSTVPEHHLSLVAKRLVDFVFAAGLLVALAPLMMLTAALIKFTSPGPVFYRQTRCGLFGRRFTLVKFRTMFEGAEDRLWEIRHLNEMDGPVFKMSNDPRITPLGRLLRISSIDELPQLWNVIKGEMSLVGPRAPLPEEVEHYTVKQRRRLSVKPGITCLWQISGRSNVDFHKWMELDLQYIDNWSFWLDLEILLRTIPAVFTARGAR